jgi:hypothetical protein
MASGVAEDLGQRGVEAGPTARLRGPLIPPVTRDRGPLALGANSPVGGGPAPWTGVRAAVTLAGDHRHDDDAVPHHRGIAMRRIVVGVDVSVHADRAPRWAVREAELWSAEVEVPGDVSLERVITRGSPAAVLLEQAGAHRLRAVGTRGRSAPGRMESGSVSHQCLNHATGPVVVVP